MGENNRLIADVKALEAVADLPIPGIGDAGKVVTVNLGHTGYQLDTNGTSSALSATKIAAVSKSGLTVTAGTVATLNLTGADIYSGEDVFTPGTALPLDVTINGGGSLVLPDDDATYDLLVSISNVGDVTDLGKAVTFHAQSSYNAMTGVGVVRSHGGAYRAQFSDAFFETLPTGDGPTPVTIEVDAQLLTADLTALSVFVVVVKR